MCRIGFVFVRAEVPVAQHHVLADADQAWKSLALAGLLGRNGILAERQARDGAAMSAVAAENRRLVVLACVPQANQAIVAAGRDGGSLRVPGHAQDLAL